MDLKIKNLVLKVKNEENPILEVENLYLKSGENLVVTGESGAGKTTFLNLISLLEFPTSGEIYWGNVKTSTLNQTQKDRFRNLNFGIVMQNFHLIQNLSAIENIMLLNLFSTNKPVKKELAMHLLNEVGITNPNLKLKLYSRGQMQRIAIVRALSCAPKVLILDEPTASLDKFNSNLITNLLTNFTNKTNATMIVASHDETIKNSFKNILDIKKNESINWQSNTLQTKEEK
ncbi:ABC transporter ATP-binding protein [Campylobacter corcagiensis]|uniref:ATP-binding cassette domain-containing protein n=1 Tax=Campylobacter corcagiensis TaxID=1448857 RepID=A0A7M1LIE8_9BACT|nr:ATP-binding cassette domain-containing protein [Campylobacter corcagiensis]QKF65327.1 ABC transporter, ATP-binding protein, FtsE/LolD family [Campylobacter corcagiensis]QOQ88091.1 ATP-binding cassette domain-containing protein [Campylobacter corcagiensis]